MSFEDDEILCMHCFDVFGGDRRSAKRKGWKEDEYGWQCKACVKEQRDQEKIRGTDIGIDKVIPAEEK